MGGNAKGAEEEKRKGARAQRRRGRKAWSGFWLTPRLLGVSAPPRLCVSLLFLKSIDNTVHAIDSALLTEVDDESEPSVT